MDNMTVTITPAMMALIPLIAAILQVAKRIKLFGNIKEYFPFISIGLTYAIIWVSGGIEGNAVIAALIIGLVASGAYDMVRLPAAKMFDDKALVETLKK